MKGGEAHSREHRQWQLIVASAVVHRNTRPRPDHASTPALSNHHHLSEKNYSIDGVLWVKVDVCGQHWRRKYALHPHQHHQAHPRHAYHPNTGKRNARAQNPANPTHDLTCNANPCKATLIPRSARTRSFSCFICSANAVA